MARVVKNRAKSDLAEGKLVIGTTTSLGGLAQVYKLSVPARGTTPTGKGIYVSMVLTEQEIQRVAEFYHMNIDSKR